MVERFISRGFRGRRQKSDVAGRLPPGQHLERGFPVLSAGPTPHTPPGSLGFHHRRQSRTTEALDVGRIARVVPGAGDR